MPDLKNRIKKLEGQIGRQVDSEALAECVNAYVEFKTTNDENAIRSLIFPKNINLSTLYDQIRSRMMELGLTEHPDYRARIQNAISGAT